MSKGIYVFAFGGLKGVVILVGGDDGNMSRRIKRGMRKFEN